MFYTINNTLPLDIYLYSLSGNKLKYKDEIKSKEEKKLKLIYNKYILTYKKIDTSENNFFIYTRSDKSIIDTHQEYIISVFRIKNNIIHRKNNNKLLFKIKNNECIMCFEIKPDSINYFQCKHCKNNFICNSCFKQLCQNKNLNNKCIICMTNYC